MVAVLGIDLLAVLLATLAYMLLGALWYSPFFLGGAWTAAMGLADHRKIEQARARVGYGVSALAGLVTATAIETIMDLTPLTGALEGALLGGLCGIGFFAMMSAPAAIFEDRSPALFAINVSYTIVGLALMGGVIGWMG